MNEVSTFVLGLKRNFRGIQLINQFQELGLNCKVIWGLDVFDFKVDFIENLIDQKKCRLILGRELSHFELSCALGHLEMYEEFLAQGTEWGIFLEDDAILGREFFRLINQISVLEPPTVLSLASSNDPRFEPRPFPFIEVTPEGGAFTDFFKCAIPPVLAHGYLMNRSAASIAVHTLRGKKIYAPADFPFEFRNQVTFYASDIEYVGVRKLQSIIDESRLQTYEKIVRNQLIKNFQRRKRVLIDYSGLGIFRARKLGISGRFYFREKVLMRQLYKKFKRSGSRKFIR
jgi:GR25 family glycosyltransferase involved in LPS biosynthesis